MTDYYFPESVMRAFIGADHLRNRLSSSAGQTSFPPHNIEQIDENNYLLSLALAGYSPEDVKVSVHNGTLIVESDKEAFASNKPDQKSFLHRGISFRHFSRSFVLGEHVQVASASMEDGLLKISLERVVPEEAKPKRIPISSKKLMNTLFGPTAEYNPLAVMDDYFFAKEKEEAKQETN